MTRTLRLTESEAAALIARMKSRHVPPVKEQAIFACGGKKLTLLQWSRELGIAKQTLVKRLEKGWPVEKALTQPLKQTSPVKNVCYDATRGKWRVEIRVNGEKRNIGRFESEAAAIEAANTARESLKSIRTRRSNGRLGKEFAPRQLCIICGARFLAPPTLMRRGGGKYCSNGCKANAMSKDPSTFPQTKNRRGIGGFREDLQKYFRSSWEANYARYLNWLVLQKQIRNWEYEPEAFEFKGIKRGTRFYTPDFKVERMDGSLEYHEVKGYMDQRSATKIKRFKKNYPNHKFVLIDKDVYRSIARTMKPLLATWDGRIRND